MNVKVHDLMTETVVTTQPHNDKIHRVIVTHEQQIVGVLSAFDLLSLVESRRFVAKNPPSTSRRKGPKRS